MTPLDNIRNISSSTLDQNYTIIAKDLFFGNIYLDDTSNTLILNATNATIKCNNYPISTKRYGGFIFAQ